MRFKTGFLAGFFLCAAFALAPEGAHAMGAAPAWLYSSSALSTTEVEVIPAGTTVPISFEIRDQSLTDQAYPYELAVRASPTNGTGWGDAIELPATAVIRFPGEVVTFQGSVTASATNGTHSYYFAIQETTDPTLSMRTCFPISFAIGAPTPTTDTSTSTKGKGGGGGGKRK